MTRFGYTLMTEQSGPKDLVRYAVSAERCGFAGATHFVRPEEAAEPLETRGIVVAERGRFRVRERSVLRYYARTIEHLLVTTGRTH